MAWYLIAAVLVFMMGVMAAGWATQRAVNNGGWTDVFWTYGTGLAGVVAALVTFGNAPDISARQWLVAGLVAIWSLRLGTYVALRVARSPEDARYTRLRKDWGADFQKRMFWFLQVQAPVTALLAISVVVAAHNPAPGLRAVDILGGLVLFAAIVGETLADREMAAFKRDPANKGKVCDVGLWGLSRHPNYFFEFFGWLAYPLIAVNGDNSWWWLAFIGPVVMYVILSRVTGVPPLEEAMVESKGEAYRNYQARVSRFMLWPRGQTA